MRIHGSAPRDRWSGADRAAAVFFGPVFKQPVSVLRKETRPDQSAAVGRWRLCAAVQAHGELDYPVRGGPPGAVVGGNARRASATRGCARGRNSGAGAQGERQDGPEQIVHVGVPDRAGQTAADHPVRVPAGAQRRVSEAIFRGIPWILAHGRIRRVQSDAGDYAVRLL